MLGLEARTSSAKRPHGAAFFLLAGDLVVFAAKDERQLPSSFPTLMVWSPPLAGQPWQASPLTWVGLQRGVEYTVEQDTHLWKRFKLFLIKSCYSLPIVLRAAQSETDPPWCATLCAHTSEDW